MSCWKIIKQNSTNEKHREEERNRWRKKIAGAIVHQLCGINFDFAHKAEAINNEWFDYGTLLDVIREKNTCLYHFYID